MNLENNNQTSAFDEVKQKAVLALSSIISQIDNSDPQHKFDLAMTALKYDVSAELANIALEAATAVEDVQAKSDMLMQLLAELSYIEDSTKR
jgi:hypothetical protein